MIREGAGRVQGGGEEGAGRVRGGYRRTREVAEQVMAGSTLSAKGEFEMWYALVSLRV